MIKKLLNNRSFLVLLFPFSLGILSVLSFQPYNFSIINFVIFPILFLLIVYVGKKSKSKYRKKPYKINFFYIGLTFSFGFYLSGLYWISYSLTFDASFKFLIPFALILIPLFLSLFNGIMILLVGQFLKNNFSSIFLFSASLAFSDYVRGNILSGFPWNVWAYTWSWQTEVLQILNFTGLYAFNILTITIFTVPAIFFFEKKLNKQIIITSTTLGFIFSCYIYGTYSINKNKALVNYLDTENKINIKVISPSFELKYNTSIEEIKIKLQNLIKYSEPDKSTKTLFVWPEGVFTGYSYEEIFQFKDLIKKHFGDQHLILFGVNKNKENTKKQFNSLIIVNNNFKILYQYNKKKLVPFGEFLPFEDTMNKLGFKKITEGYGSFTNGSKQDNFVYENLNVLPLICYEIIFPQLTQNSPTGTNLIINISEDGWFGNSIGPHQHFAKAIFRSIETNSYLLRSANKGISTVLSNKGEIIKTLNTNEIGSIELEIPLIVTEYKNKNDLIFFVLLFTYLLIFLIFRNKN